MEQTCMSQIGATPSLGSLAVLVAEDNVLNQRIIVRMVRALGC
jgi:hypothetical protein